MKFTLDKQLVGTDKVSNIISYTG